ncbi:hypothetical protein HZS_7665 [Henneguya salminicola]|nr:hypothetical protein HZS_7665 [Henneguya salminicola]
MIRQRINFPLTILPDAAHINIPAQYKISFRNENFLLYDGYKMMENDLFSSQRLVNLNILSRSSNSYFDSTFKSVPEIFYHGIQQCINSMRFCVNSAKN